MAKTTTYAISHWSAMNPAASGAIQDEALDTGMSLEEAALAVVMDTKIRSENTYREKKTNMLDYMFHYLNKPRKRNIPNAQMMNNLTVPIASETVDTALAYIMNKFYKSMKLCHLKPTTMGDIDLCSIFERKLEYDNRIMKIDKVLYPLVKMALIFGSAPGFSKYAEIRQQYRGMPDKIGNLPEQTTYEGSTLEAIDVFDLFPAPEKLSIDDFKPIIRRSFKSWEELKANESQLEYFDIDLIPEKRLSIPMDLNELRHERRELLKMGKGQDIFPDSIEVLEWEGMFPVSGKKDKYDQYIYEPAIITVANKTLIGMRRNKNLSGKNNMVMGVIDWNMGGFWGMGIVEKIHSQVHQANSLQDLILDNLPMITNRMFIADEKAIVNPAAFIARPGGIIPIRRQNVQTLRDSVIPLDFPPMPDQVFRYYFETINRAEMASGSTEVAKGGGATSVETATEARAQTAWGSNRLELCHRLFEKTLVEPDHAYRALINQDLVSPDFIEKIFPGKGPMWRKIQDSKGFAVQPDFIALSSTRETDERLLVQQIHQLLEIVKGHPITEGLLPILIMKLAEAYNWVESEPIIKEAKIGYHRHLAMLKAKMDADASQLPVNANQGNVVAAPATGGSGQPGQTKPGQTTSRPQSVGLGSDTQLAKSLSQTMGKMGK